jgi:hypothetical protein
LKKLSISSAANQQNIQFGLLALINTKNSSGSSSSWMSRCCFFVVHLS